MKQNELFNKCCENIDPKTREEVWKQMDKELGRTELERAAEDYALSLSKSSMGGKEYCKQDFKAGAEWQKQRDKEWAFKQFSDILDKWEAHAIEGMRVGASAYHQGKIALICDLRDWIKGGSK